MPMLPPALTGRPAMGSSPVAQPSGNPGMAAAATAQVLAIVKQLGALVNQFQPGTEAHKTIVKSIEMLSKNFSQAQASPGLEKTAMLANLQTTQEQAPMMAMLRAQTGQAMPNNA